jgi:hypothetical protein
LIAVVGYERRRCLQAEFVETEDAAEVPVGLEMDE